MKSIKVDQFLKGRSNHFIHSSNNKRFNYYNAYLATSSGCGSAFRTFIRTGMSDSVLIIPISLYNKTETLKYVLMFADFINVKYEVVELLSTNLRSENFKSKTLMFYKNYKADRPNNELNFIFVIARMAMWDIVNKNIKPSEANYWNSIKEFINKGFKLQDALLLSILNPDYKYCKNYTTRNIGHVYSNTTNSVIQPFKLTKKEFQDYFKRSENVFIQNIFTSPIHKYMDYNQGLKFKKTFKKGSISAYKELLRMVPKKEKK